MALPTPPGRIPVTLWHRPDSTESRRLEALLAPLPVDCTLVNVLDAPPAVSALQEAVEKLGTGARALLDSDDPRAETLADADDEAVLEAMAAHPTLIRVPLAFVHGRAVIARPAELVYRFLAPPVADGGDAIRALLQRKR